MHVLHVADKLLRKQAGQTVLCGDLSALSAAAILDFCTNNIFAVLLKFERSLNSYFVHNNIRPYIWLLRTD